MKKVFTFLFAIALGASALAQTIQSIDDQVSIEVKRIVRIEKYGWDNLEIAYKIINKSDRNLKRVDFTVALMDGNGFQIGIIDVHDFYVQKRSKKKCTYIEMSPEFVNTDIREFKLLSKSIRPKTKQGCGNQSLTAKSN